MLRRTWRLSTAAPYYDKTVRYSTARWWNLWILICHFIFRSMIYHLVEYFDINKQLKMRNINFRLDLEIGPCLYLENFVVPSLYLSFICFAFACICFCLICMSHVLLPASVSGFRMYVCGGACVCIWDSGTLGATVGQRWVSCFAWHPLSPPPLT